MKRIFLAASALGALSLVSPALGADLAAYTKAPALAAPGYDWSGFYAGAFGGGGYGNHNVNSALGPNTPFANYAANYSSQGGVAGGEAGYNWQSGRVVLGIEADGFWSDIKGDDAAAVNAGNFAVTSVDATELRWGGSLRARGGLAVDRLLLFFTGGWAFGDLLHTSTDAAGAIDQFTSHRNGLAAGGGIAYALTDNLIGKLEYRYYDFGRYTRAAPLNAALPYTVDSTYSVVTVGLDFKWGGSVVAKY
jgi:outer membrane immunogenic protein